MKVKGYNVTGDEKTLVVVSSMDQTTDVAQSRPKTFTSLASQAKQSPNGTYPESSVRKRPWNEGLKSGVTDVKVKSTLLQKSIASKCSSAQMYVIIQQIKNRKIIKQIVNLFRMDDLFRLGGNMYDLIF